MWTMVYNAHPAVGQGKSRRDRPFTKDLKPACKCDLVAVKADMTLREGLGLIPPHGADEKLNREAEGPDANDYTLDDAFADAHNADYSSVLEFKNGGEDPEEEEDFD